LRPLDLARYISTSAVSTALSPGQGSAPSGQTKAPIDTLTGTERPSRKRDRAAGDVLEHAAQHALQQLGVGLGQPDQELLAAPAHHAVDLAHGAAQPPGDGLQHQVADGVPVGVVEHLEMVDVDQGQRSALAVRGFVARQQALHGAAVAQAGERVDLAERGQVAVAARQQPVGTAQAPHQHRQQGDQADRHQHHQGGHAVAQALRADGLLAQRVLLGQQLGLDLALLGIEILLRLGQQGAPVGPRVLLRQRTVLGEGAVGGGQVAGLLQRFAELLEPDRGLQAAAALQLHVHRAAHVGGALGDATQADLGDAAVVQAEDQGAVRRRRQRLAARLLDQAGGQLDGLVGELQGLTGLLVEQVGVAEVGQHQRQTVGVVGAALVLQRLLADLQAVGIAPGKAQHGRQRVQCARLQRVVVALLGQANRLLGVAQARARAGRAAPARRPARPGRPNAGCRSRPAPASSGPPGAAPSRTRGRRLPQWPPRGPGAVAPARAPAPPRAAPPWTARTAWPRRWSRHPAGATAPPLDAPGWPAAPAGAARPPARHASRPR
jgi:hypothetical protein